MRQIVQYVDRQTKPMLVIQVLLLVLLLGGIDYLTGAEFSFSVFYTLPIAIAGWFAGRGAGILTSFTAATCWLAADLLGGHAYTQPTIPFWNAAVRLGFFTIITVILAELHASRARQEELSHFIVHDLRSPLSVIITGLTTLRDFSDDALTPDQEELVQFCLSAGDRMLTIINALLDLARLESRHMPIQPVECDVAQIVQAVVDPLRLWAGQKGITLGWTVAPETATVYADRVLIERILANLLAMPSSTGIPIPRSASGSSRGRPAAWCSTSTIRARTFPLKPSTGYSTSSPRWARADPAQAADWG